VLDTDVRWSAETTAAPLDKSAAILLTRTKVVFIVLYCMVFDVIVAEFIYLSD
jgi:hypothetical protein